MKVTKKVLSLLLSLCMVMSCFAISAFAAEEQSELTYEVDKVLFTKTAEVKLTGDKNYYNLGQEDGAPSMNGYEHLEYKYDFKLSEMPQSSVAMGSLKAFNTEGKDVWCDPIKINADGSLNIKPDEPGIIEAGKTYTVQYRFHIGDTADTYDILLTEGGTTKLDMKNSSTNVKKFIGFQYMNLRIGVGTVLSNMSVTSIIPTKPTVYISVPFASNIRMSTIAAGKNIRVDVASYYCSEYLANGGDIKIFNNGAEVSSSSQENFSQICTINVGSNNIYAAVYDSEGTLIDKSITYTIEGVKITQHETGNWSTNSTTSGVGWNFNKSINQDEIKPSDTNMYTCVNAHSELTVDGVVRNNIGTATWDSTKNLDGTAMAEGSKGITQVQYAYPGAAPSQLQTAQGRFFEAGVEIKYSESKPVNSTLIISANLFTTYDGTKYDDPTWNNAAIATSPEGYLKCGGDLTDVMVDLSLWHKYSVFGDSETDILYFFLDDEFIYAKKCSVNFIGLARANSSFDTAPGKQVTAYVDNGYLSTFDLAIPMVTASAQVASDKYFAGKKVNINVQSKFCDDILADGGSIKLYKNGSLLETSTSESFAASVIVEDGINALEAVVYNKDGEVVANDNSLKIKAVSMLQHPTGNWSYDTESGLGTANWNFGSSDTAMYTKQIAAEYTDKVTGEIRNRVGIATWDDTKNLDDTEIAEGSVGIHQVQSSHPNSIVNNMNAVGGQGSIFEAGIELKYSESKLNKNEMTVVSCNVFTTYDAETGYAGAAWRDVNMSVGTDGYIYCSRVKTDVKADITNWHKYSIMCDTETDTMYFFVDDEFIYSKKSGNDIKGYARANSTYDYFPGKKVTAYFDNPYVNTYNLSNAVNAVENLTVTSGGTAIDSLASATAGAPLTVSGFIAKNAESADEAVNVYVALYKGTALSAVKLANVALSDDYNQFSITIDEAPADIASGFTMKLLAWNTSLVPYFTSIDPFAN